MDFGIWSSDFGLLGLHALVFGLQSLVCRIGTPCYVVLNEYSRSGHSILYYYESTVKYTQQSNETEGGGMQHVRSFLFGH